MRLKLIAAACGLALAAYGGAGVAMTDAEGPAIRCTVSGAEKIPGLGGAGAVCDIIVQAVSGASRSAGVEASVAVEVLSPHAMVARTVVDGHRLAERRIDISDRTLNAQAVETLARAIAQQLRDRHGDTVSGK